MSSIARRSQLAFTATMSSPSNTITFDAKLELQAPAGQHHREAQVDGGILHDQGAQTLINMAMMRQSSHTASNSNAASSFTVYRIYDGHSEAEIASDLDEIYRECEEAYGIFASGLAMDTDHVASNGHSPCSSSEPTINSNTTYLTPDYHLPSHRDSNIQPDNGALCASYGTLDVINVSDDHEDWVSQEAP